MVPVEEKHLVFNEDKWLIYYYLAWDNKTFHRQWGEIASISMSNGDRPFTLFNTETALMECVWDTVNTTKTTSVDICMSWMRQLCECCVHCTVIHLISGNACRDQAEFKRNWKTWKSATQWGSLITAYWGPRKCFMACKGIWRKKKIIYIYMFKKKLSTVLFF